MYKLLSFKTFCFEIVLLLEKNNRFLCFFSFFFIIFPPQGSSSSGGSQYSGQVSTHSKRRASLWRLFTNSVQFSFYMGTMFKEQKLSK